MAILALERPGQLFADPPDAGVQIAKIRRAEPNHPPPGGHQPSDARVIADDLAVLEVIGTLVLHDDLLLRPRQVNLSEPDAVQMHFVLRHRRW